jgi:hypothetical protein
MIPQGASISGARIVSAERPSLTWCVDYEAGRLTGRVDGLSAVQQAVTKILQTPRFWHVIYSGSYGHELESLIGKNPLLVRSEAARMVTEAILQDDRVTAVQDVTADVADDRLTVACTVVTRYGSFRTSQEVTAVV